MYFDEYPRQSFGVRQRVPAVAPRLVSTFPRPGIVHTGGNIDGSDSRFGVDNENSRLEAGVDQMAENNASENLPLEQPTNSKLGTDTHGCPEQSYQLCGRRKLDSRGQRWSWLRQDFHS